jgi:hypothetical protein
LDGNEQNWKKVNDESEKGHLKIRERIAVWVCRKAIKSLKSIEYTDGIV